MKNTKYKEAKCFFVYNQIFILFIILMLEKNTILQEFSTITTKEQLTETYQKYLGKNGIISSELKNLSTFSLEEKKEKGKQLTELRQSIEDLFEKKEKAFLLEEINQTLQKDSVDLFVPAQSLEEGFYSLSAKTRREIDEIAQSMGFIVEMGAEVVSKFENFESVNIPISHPATEMHDTIYVDQKDERGENYVLRTHTSSAQNYILRKYGVPIKAIVSGKVYRFDEMDATHDVMFYQTEGIYVDKNISMANFKDILTTFLSTTLKKEVEIRMRPAFFPFTEPGVEVDARYEYFNMKTGKKELSDWVEILGAGMIHENVLKAAGINPEE
ncbi:phenylalanine--tRNA ligase subunit alpha [bacterium]|nr:phenylalanine--tRNA ligase subunit alpha [bacterium]